MADDNYYGEMDKESDDHAGSDPAAGEDYSGESALIPKSLLGGKEFKVGDEIIFKIDHEYEDQVEISYAKADKGGDKKSEMSKADDMMDGMAKDNMEE